MRDGERAKAEAGGGGGAATVFAGVWTPRGSWWPVVGLIAAIAVLRVVYLAWVSPFGLVEDEAQYWVWSQHLDLSYYTKGPGVAWGIALVTAALGDAEWVVRLPSVIAGAVASAAVALLVVDMTRGDRRAALWAVAAVNLAPVFQAVWMLGTIDGPYVACWALACWLAWRAMVGPGRGVGEAGGGGDASGARVDRSRGWAWMGLAIALGVGFLYKYTILLLLPSVAALGWMAGRRGLLPRRWWLWAAAAAVVFALTCLPVVFWNQLHGWPTVKHLLGHLGFSEKLATAGSAGGVGGGAGAGGGAGVGVGGAEAVLSAQGGGRPGAGWWRVLWPLEYVGMQLGMVGPLAALGSIAAWWVWRGGTSAGQSAAAGRDAARERLAELYLVVCAAPIVLFYFGVSLVTKPEGNWPMAGFVTLLALAGLAARAGVSAQQRMLAEWLAKAKPRPREGFVRRKPETVGQVLWHVGLAYGLAAGLGAMSIQWFAFVPGIRGAVARLSQGQTLAEAVQRLRERVRAGEHGGEPTEPIIIAQHYGQTSQLAYYLPDKPVVFCASGQTGGRPVPQDFWEITSLSRQALIGRDAILIGGDAATWAPAFLSVQEGELLAGVERKGVRWFVGRNFRGFRAAAAGAPAGKPGGSGRAP